ncbi:response regulator, partial [candidate division KSB1 bacterium]|nr:response regulator [candidate division KSB1 bacterium]
EAREVARNGADLTHQLLAFSRRQPLRPRAIDLGEMIDGTATMLRRTLGDTIDIDTVAPGELWPTLADPGQIETALLNLALNARDAMPKGGKLTIETGLYLAAETFLVEQNIRLGSDSNDEAASRFVKITVTDNGVGMDQQTRSRIFEPFFTTKEVGKGTGLGLAVVYGIVKQHKGVIQVSSKLKQGTAFEIYFPAVSKTEKARLEKTAAQPMVGGKELILVVEDESAVRNVSIRILSGLGYRVLAAHDGNAALKIFADEAGIDLVIVDVVMPGQSGPDTYKKMIKQKANLPAVFVTGYDVQSEISGIADLDGERIALLQKPYTRESLGKKVREVLDHTGSGKK